MRRVIVVVASLSILSGAGLSADVRSDQRIKFQLGGAIGKLVNMFGGKGAREGVTSMVAVKGNRKVVMSDSIGQIVDLTEEKVYDLDVKKKTYTVTTFAQIRKQMEEARLEAEKAAREQRAEAGEPSEPAEKDPNAKEFEVDFDVKNTTETRTIIGFEAKKTVMTVTVREKGKTLNDSGGLVMVTDLWLTPNAPSTRDLTDFEVRYAQKLSSPVAVTGASAQDMAMATAMYPQMKPALDKMRAEGGKIEGTAILTDTRIEAVPPGTANQTAEAMPAPEAAPKKGFGGMLGGLKKMAEASQQQGNSNAKPTRSIIMTTTVELLKLTADVDAASVAIPAGYSEKK